MTSTVNQQGKNSTLLSYFDGKNRDQIEIENRLVLVRSQEWNGRANIESLINGYKMKVR